MDRQVEKEGQWGQKRAKEREEAVQSGHSDLDKPFIATNENLAIRFKETDYESMAQALSALQHLVCMRKLSWMFQLHCSCSTVQQTSAIFNKLYNYNVRKV